MLIRRDEGLPPDFWQEASLIAVYFSQTKDKNIDEIEEKAVISHIRTAKDSIKTTPNIFQFLSILINWI